ncbi:MAG: autotransporter-associated beta strand repeat-containing protein [Opitutales bacterium]|nr:autotransporter-associated beta strand repeat-containing protein [Opitutales bacterium]
MKTTKFLLPTLIAAAAMTASAYAEIDSAYGTLEWTTAPTTGGDFYSADYGLAFNFTSTLFETLTDGKSYVVAAYWGNSPSDTYGANAIVLTNNGGTYSLTAGRGKLSDTDLDADTTFTFQDNVVFSQAIVADTAYSLSVTGGNQAMTPTLTWGSETETQTSYAGNMNGNPSSMNSGLLTLYYVTDSVWGGGESGNWSDDSWTTGASTNQPLGSLANVSFNSSVAMTATEDVTVNSITVAEGAILTLDGTGAVSTSGLTLNGTVSVSSGAKLELTTETGAQNQLLDYSKVSGDGTLSLALNTVNGQGVNASDFTGTLFISGNGRVQLNQTTLGEGAVVEFADGADMVLNGEMTSFAHDMTINGTSQLYFNQTSSTEVEFSGAISGGTLVLENANTRTLNLSGAVSLSGLSVSQNKTVKFTGEGATVGTVTLNSTGTIGGKVAVTNLNLADGTSFTGFADGSEVSVTNAKATGGTSSISSALNLSGSLWVGGATLNLDSGANVTASKFRIAEQGTSTVNINSGAVLTITGDDNTHSTNTSLLLSHWGYASTLTLNGGKLVAESAEMKMGWTGAGTFSAQSGEARLSGLNFWAQDSNFRGHFILGSAASGDAKVYLGSSGVKDLALTTADSTQSSVTLGNGTLGATDSWSTSYNSGYTPITIQLVGTNGGTVFDTEDPDDSTGHTITINHAMAGPGKLVKDGAGTLALMKDSSYSGGTTISAGTLVAGANSALGDASGSVTISGGQLSVSENVTLTQTAITIVLSDVYNTENTEKIAAIAGAGAFADGTTITLDKAADAVALALVTDAPQKYSYQIFDSTSSLVGTDWTFELGSAWDGWAQSYDTTSGVLTLTIPEPSAFGLLAGLGALALVASRRKRRK